MQIIKGIFEAIGVLAAASVVVIAIRVYFCFKQYPDEMGNQYEVEE